MLVFWSNARGLFACAPRGLLGLRCLLGTLGSLSLLGALSACEASRGAGEERSAQPGVRQVGSAEGPLVDEAEACERYREALAEALGETGCEDEFELGQCPELIRPGGATACTRFSEESLSSCEESIAEYESCADFSRRRCILVSVLGELSEGCVVPTPPEAGTGGGEGGADLPEAGGPPVNGELDAAMAPPPDAGPAADAASSQDPEALTDAGGGAGDAAAGSAPEAGEGATLGDAGDGADQSLEDAATEAPRPDAGPLPVVEAGADAGELPDAG